jgi:tyrosinase
MMMAERSGDFSRRTFIAASGALAAGTALSPAFAQTTAARYRRYNVTSPMGQRMLASYARGVAAMLALPPEHPQNWFRNAFIHLMDCPHGNWWFYVWHRGYVGYFEETIRNLSGDPEFAMPYWDWTQLPQMPDAMFNGVLDPGNPAFAATTRNLAVFTARMKPALAAYWSTLNAAQLAQLALRGYPTLDAVWNDVDGYSPAQQIGVAGNIAFSPPCSARYLTRDNPKLDAKTAYDVSPPVITAGLAPTVFNQPDIQNSFTSSRTPSHNTAPGSATKFSILEGLPHNKVHNYIGGVGPLDPGPYGNMTNFLSPVDPVFFLHHSNMDRLWYVWEQKQRRIGLPWLPTGADFQSFASEPFLFYVDGNGNFVGNAQAGSYINTTRFGYDYEPGFGETPESAPVAKAKARGLAMASLAATQSGSSWTASIPEPALKAHLAASPGLTLIAEIALARPADPGAVREFDVLINAPDDLATVSPDSPYYAGTLAFFGPVMIHGEHGGHGGHSGHGGNAAAADAGASFAVPLPRKPTLFALDGTKSAPVKIRLVPAGRGTSVPAAQIVKSVQLHAL